MCQILKLILFCLVLISQGCRRDATQASGKTLPEDATRDLQEVFQPEKADSLFKVAENYARHNKTDSALLIHLRVIESLEKVSPDDERLLRSLRKVALHYLVEVKYEQADKFFERARRLAEKISSPDTILIRIYNNLASCKLQLSDYPTALSLMQKVLQLVRMHENESPLSIARIHRKLGSISFYKKDYEEAIRQYSNSIRLTNPIDNVELAQINSQIGMVYNAAKMNHRSLQYYLKALQYLQRSSTYETDEKAKVYLQKAFAHLDLGQFDSARYCLSRNLQIRRKVFGEKNSNTFGAKYSLGTFYFTTQNYDSAIWYLQSSLISLIKNFDQQDVLANPRPALDELNIDVVHALLSKAKTLKSIFEIGRDRIELLEGSLSTYLLADSVFGVFCSNNLRDDAVLVQMENKRMPYPEMLQTSVELYNLTGASRYLFKAFEIMERSRATLLRNALGRAQAFGTAGISNAFLEKENELTRLRAELLQQLGRVSGSQKKVDSLYEKLFKVNSLHADLQLDLEKSNPNYAAIRYGIRELDQHDLKVLLNKKNAVLLEFLWSEGAIYGLLITKDTVRLQVIPVTDSIKNAVEDYGQGLLADVENLQDMKKFKTFLQASRYLYHHLLDKFLKEVTPGIHLIVSADGPLATLPFEAMVTEEGIHNEVNYKLPYLILQHPISYTYSSDILVHQSLRPREGDRLLAYGYAGTRKALKTTRNEADLPGTEKEVLAIRQVMKNGQNEYLLEGAASERSFKKHAGEFDIVHLAVHGKADTLNSLNSRLIFRTEADTVEDGSLYAHELYDMNLQNLDLAVLSACESGVGKQQAGEGVMSIARGFSYAGCPSLIISLWKIDDGTSAEVMSSFYQYTSEGKDLDEALALAKNNYLTRASEFTSHPYYWSAFLDVGDTRAIKNTNFNGVWTILIIIILIVLFISIQKLQGRS